MSLLMDLKHARCSPGRVSYVKEGTVTEIAFRLHSMWYKINKMGKQTLRYGHCELVGTAEPSPLI